MSSFSPAPRASSPLLNFLDRLPVAIHPAHHPVWFLTTAAILTSLFWALAFVVIWPRDQAAPGNRGARGPEFIEASPFTAKVLQTEQVEWAADTPRFQVGMLLAAGDELELNSGRIQVLFGRGTRMAIQGPARLRIDSDNSLTLQYGRILSRVTFFDHGFVVQTPVVKIVDMGTEFGVDARESETEVHVFEGQVKVWREDGRESSSLALSAKQAALFGVSPQAEFFVKELEMNRAIYLSLAAMLSLPTSPVIDNAQTAQAILLMNGAPDPSFAGLKAWYDAASIGVGDGNAVATWSSSASTPNNATQANVARQPIWIANGLNNLPAVSFDGAGGNNGDQLIMATNIFQNASLPNTYFAVLRTSDTAGHIIGLGTSSDANPSFLINWGSGLLINGTPAVRANNSPSGFRIEATTTDLTSGTLISARAGTSGTSWIRIMGIQENSTSTAGNTYPYGRATIGASDGDSSNVSINPFAGEISEILIYGALTEQQILDVENYLYVKYFTQTASPEPAPEPASGAILGLSCFVFVCLRQQSRRGRRKVASSRT